MKHSTKCQQAGFSLLEGLTILLIASLLLSIGTPDISGAIDRSRTSSHLNALVATLNLARTYAITENSSTTLCASASGTQCDGDWNDGRLLFVDRNNNRTVDAGEQLVERGHRLSGQVDVRWQASGGRNKYIRFSRHGTAMEFGRFTYCPKSRNAAAASMLILNRMGRVHIAEDVNGDGVVEDSKGRSPAC